MAAGSYGASDGFLMIAGQCFFRFPLLLIPGLRRIRIHTGMVCTHDETVIFPVRNIDLAPFQHSIFSGRNSVCRKLFSFSLHRFSSFCTDAAESEPAGPRYPFLTRRPCSLLPAEVMMEDMTDTRMPQTCWSAFRKTTAFCPELSTVITRNGKKAMAHRTPAFFHSRRCSAASAGNSPPHPPVRRRFL